jgi:type I restriction enzyme M protein
MTEAPRETPIWRVFDFLRGELQPSEVLETLAALIVLRWVDFQEAEREAIAAFEDAPFEPIMSPRLHWRSWHSLKGQRLGEFLNDELKWTLNSIGEARQEPLAFQLSQAAEGIDKLLRLPFVAQEQVVHWLAEQPFETPSDRLKLLRAFDEALDRFSDSRSGFDRTPAAIAQLIVSLANPKPGDRIYDPCFGSAGLLTSAAAYVTKKEGDAGRLRGSVPLDVSGIEIRRTSYLIGLTRMLLSGIEEPHLELGNSLEREFQKNPGAEGFDVVIANPPWGAKIDPIGLGHLPVQTSDSAALFIQHALGQLKPGGRAVVVVPQGLLFRGGADRAFRKWLIETHALESVVSLGGGAFLPYTAVQASVLSLRRGKSAPQIRFVDAEPLLERSRAGKGKTLTNEAIEQIVRAANSASGTEISWDLTLQELIQLEWDLTPKRRWQTDFDSQIEGLRAQMPVMVLSELCTVTTGVNVKSSDMLDSPGEHAVPFIRVKDIERGVVSKGTAWVETTDKRIPGGHLLRGGDILLSKSGTIGKSGIVRNGAIGAIASAGLYEIHATSDQLDANYLLAYLNSPECQARFSSQATGATIQHLPIGALRDLPVPVPTLPLQLRIAEQFREQGTDALGFLTLLSGTTERDPVGEWLEKALRGLPQDSEPIDEPLNFESLERLLGELKFLRNRVAHDSESGPLSAWILSFHESMSRLQGMQMVPPGPSLLNLLQSAANSVQKSLGRLSGRLPIEARARTLAGTVLRMISTASDALLDDVKIAFEAEDEAIWAGDYNLVHVSIRNEGALPIRGLTIATSPDWGTSDVPYLAEGMTSRIQIDGDAPPDVETFEITFSWKGRALDGRPVEGTRQVAFDVDSKNRGTITESVELGASPYVCGDPVRPERNDVFFGREELINKIRRTVTRSGNVVLLEGNRRAGKSSILWHLEGLQIPGWLGVYCSLQGAEGSAVAVGVPTAEVFREIASSIAKSVFALGVETLLPNGEILPAADKLDLKTRLHISDACRDGIGEHSAFSDLREFVGAVLDQLRERNLGILLMLDEFDKLQEGIDNGVTSPQVPENIRFLVQNFPQFSAILTGSRRLKRLREEYWSALFGLGTREGVTALDESAARKLVTDPVKGRLSYSREAIDYVIRMTACHPFILQSLCNRIFDHAAELNARTVGLDLAQRGAKELIEGWEHFASLWDYAQSDRRRFILALCHRLSAGPDPVSFRVIQEHLANHGIDVSDEALIEDIEFLKELELLDYIDQKGAGIYVLTIPLMGDWITAQQDFEVLRSKARSENEDSFEPAWTQADEVAAQRQAFGLEDGDSLEDFWESWDPSDRD